MPIENRPKAHIVIINHYNLSVLQRSPKLDRLLSNIFESEAEKLFQEFTRYILNLYKSLILHAIKKQKFPKKYPPLSKSWVNYKKRHGLKKGFWRAYGFLTSNLTVWRVKKNVYAIGFKRNLEHPASAPGVKEFQINVWLEKGTKYIPARPLYWHIARSIQRHLYDIHFKRFIKDMHPELEKFLD